MRRSAAVYHKFTEEEIRQANSVDILSLARGYGYEPEKAGRKAVHMKHSGGLYIFPENNRFFQWTGPDDGIKGGAIDFVMREENLSFPEAVGKLIGKEYVAETRQVTPYEKKERGPLELPDKAENMKRAYWYLVSVRGISPQIVSHFMNRKMIYQEKKYGNCVFVGYDSEGAPRYCSMRAARENSSFKMDATGSDKSYPFFHEGTSDLLIVTEAPIDLMSHASIAADSMGGTGRRITVSPPAASGMGPLTAIWRATRRSSGWCLRWTMIIWPVTRMGNFGIGDSSRRPSGCVNIPGGVSSVLSMFHT